MTLTIDLKPELEARLREAAAETGLDTGAFVVHALEEQLERTRRGRMPSRLSQVETELLQKINQGLPEAMWQEYDDLVAKRRAETLTTQEHARLISLSDTIEAAHAERMTHVAELAGHRQVSLKMLIEELGIKPRIV